MYSKIIKSLFAGPVRLVKGAACSLPHEAGDRRQLIHISWQSEAKNYFDVASKFHTFARDKSQTQWMTKWQLEMWQCGNWELTTFPKYLAYAFRLHIIKKHVKWRGKQ